MTEVQIARKIAHNAHFGQVEESTGEPYIMHIERIVDAVSGEPAKAVAWLHDVLEDSRFTANDLLTFGISDEVIASVVVVTRTLEETYSQYIDRIVSSGDPLALAVKIADLKDHFRPGCPKRLLPRYEKAWAVLCPGVPLP